MSKKKRSSRGLSSSPAETTRGGRAHGSPRDEGKQGASWGLGLVLVGAAALIGVVWMTSSVRQRDRSSEPTVPAPQAPVARPAPASTPALGSPAGASAAKRDIAERVNAVNQLLAQGKTEEALARLRELAKENPKDEDIHYNLGIALAREGKNDEAAAEYEEALKLFADYAEVHNNYGNLLLRMGKLDDAIAHLEQAVKITPDYAAAWNNYGTALQRAGKTNEALENFQKAASLDTNYWQAHFNVATALLQRKQFAQAETAFETVLRLQPAFTPAKEALAKAKVGMTETGH